MTPSELANLSHNIYHALNFPTSSALAALGD